MKGVFALSAFLCLAQSHAILGKEAKDAVDAIEVEDDTLEPAITVKATETKATPLDLSRITLERILSHHLAARIAAEKSRGLIVYFWNLDCSDCKNSLTDLIKLSKGKAAKTMVVAVEDAAKSYGIRRFLGSAGFEGKALLVTDSKKDLWEKLQLKDPAGWPLIVGYKGKKDPKIWGETAKLSDVGVFLKEIHK